MDEYAARDALREAQQRVEAHGVGDQRSPDEWRRLAIDQAALVAAHERLLTILDGGELPAPDATSVPPVESVAFPEAPFGVEIGGEPVVVAPVDEPTQPVGTFEGGLGIAEGSEEERLGLEPGQPLPEDATSTPVMTPSLDAVPDEGEFDGPKADPEGAPTEAEGAQTSDADHQGDEATAEVGPSESDGA